MPRASQYLLEGYVYHLTQRCHNRRFLLGLVRDRNAYRDWWREAVKRFRLPVYAYCITRNHVHAVVYAANVEAVSGFMHLASGSTAKAYNLRTGVEGSMWEHPYQCTVVESGRHLLNCLLYIDLNMVRAGVVAHPRDWKWCGYDELTGARKRYRILDIEHLMSQLDFESAKDFRSWYAESMETRLREGLLRREPCWTESLAVGSHSFIENLQDRYTWRQRLITNECATGKGTAWAIREDPASYGSI